MTQELIDPTTEEYFLNMAPVELMEEVADMDEIHALRARYDPAAFASYVLRDEETGLPIRLQPMHDEWHQLASYHKRLLIWAHVEAGKALPLDTKIPTPSGWRTMGDLVKGALVFDAYGNPTPIKFVTETMLDRECFRVEFDDGSSQVTDADHQWRVWNVDDLAADREPRVATTREMADKVMRGRDFFWKVPIAGAVQYPERELPLPPYFFGCWIGDGDSRAASITTPDLDMIPMCCEALGIPTSDVSLRPQRGCVRAYFKGIRKRLAPFFQKKTRIPDVFLLASEVQRRELLAGLMDTDGGVERGSKVSFSTIHQTLASDVLQLVRSLGFKARMAPKRGTYKGELHLSWRVNWTAKVPVFRVQRKLNAQKLGKVKATRHKTVRAVVPVASVPVRCIGVEAETHTYLCGESYTVTHNSTQLSVARALWELGRNPNLRICIISNTYDLATKICTTIGKTIEESEQFRKVFPGTKRDKSMPWSSSVLYVERDTAIRDPSVRSLGIHGNILGARIDLLIIDDILDYENTLSAHQRQDLYDWFRSTLETRLTRDARVLCVGTAWHRDDIMHRFARRKDFIAVRYPVMDEETHELNWPERWPADRIEEKRAAVGPVEFNRSLLCIARSDEESRFKKDWLDRCMRRGEGSSLTHALERVPDGYSTFTGVDLGVRVKAGSDLTVLFTIIVHPNGDREVLEVNAGRWTGPQIVQLIIDTHFRYQSIVIVENNAAQEFIVQFTKDSSAVPVRSFTTTGANVKHPQFGLEGVATEMSLGKWIIPNVDGQCHSQVQAWIDEMLYYDPQSHPGDRLMASWFAREGSRLTRPKARVQNVDLLTR